MKRKFNLIKIFVVAAICLGVSAKSIAQDHKEGTKTNDKIHFIEDAWAEALKQAAAQNKYIFVDAYASWCGPCKILKATTFKNAQVATFYNQNFVNVSLDMEKGVGPKLAAEWQLQAYPTLIIFTPKGKAVLGTVGLLQPNELLKFGREALAKKM